MKHLYVYGTGYLDFIKLVEAINRNRPSYHISGFINDLSEFKGKKFRGYPVLGSKEIIPQLIAEGDACFFHNINSTPLIRRRIANTLEETGCEVVSLIHPLVDMNYVEYGIGCFVPEGCIIGSNVKIGRYLTCRLGSLISHDVTIKDFVYIGPGATCCGFSQLGEGCFIGGGATILTGVKIGAETVIGAGSTVTRDIPNKVVAYGTPAKVIREVRDDERRD